MESTKFKLLINSITKEMNVYNVCDFYNNHYNIVNFINKKSNIYSLSKNVTSLCIGILFDKKLLSLQDDIYNIFKDEYPTSISYKGVTIEDVLKQVTGIKEGFLDIDVEDKNSFDEDDYLKIIFKKGLFYHDKNHFVYSDSNYYLLGRIVKKVSGLFLQDFIVKYIFTPLEIIDYEFVLDPIHNQMGATGIFLHSYDVNKIGQIFIDGTFFNQRIVSSEYINLSKSKLVKVDEKIKYGFSLWFNDESKIYYGCGMLGQMFVLLDEEVISLISEDKNNKIELLKDILLRKDVQNGNL